MPRISPDKIRVLAVVGHGHAGKTTLVEAMLTRAGAVSRAGRVEDGSTRTDYDPEEVERKLSINAVPATFMWKDTEVCAVDCPGYVDFLPETKAVLNAVDSGLLVVSAAAGVEPGAERVFDYARELGVPLIAFVAKMDRETADFQRAVDGMTQATGAKFVPYWLPIGSAESFRGYVDVFHGRACLDGKEAPVPEDMKAEVAAARDRLIEAAVEIDDALVEKYLAGEEIGDADLRRGMEEGMLAGKFVPVFCGSAARDIGIAHLLDVLVEYAATPLERTRAAATAEGEAKYTPAQADEPLAHCFKVLHEPHVGDVALVRVLDGVLTTGQHVINSSRNVKEKIGTMFRVVGRERQEVTELCAGEVGALVKLHGIQAGDSLCAEQHPRWHAPVAYPEPTFTTAVRPATQADGEKLANLLSKLGHEDPSIRAYTDPVTHEIIFAGPGDLALDVFLHRLEQRFRVKVVAGKPRIPYRETLRGKAEAEGKIKKQTGGRGQFAIVNLRVEPNPGQGFEFVDAVVGGAVPRNFIPAVEKGLREALPRGVIAGYPLTDIKVTLFFGKYHDVDSSEQAFKSAAAIGLREAVRAARPVLLEPIMLASVRVQDGAMGDVIGDLNTRRGKIIGVEPDGRMTNIRALVPLAELHRYVTTLRSMTGGRGEFSAKLDHYDEVPPNQAQPIINEWNEHRDHAAPDTASA